MGQFLDVDDRRRTTLIKVGHHRQYLAEELPDGTVVLHPAVVMPEVQARLLAAPICWRSSPQRTGWVPASSSAGHAAHVAMLRPASQTSEQLGR